MALLRQYLKCRMLGDGYFVCACIEKDRTPQKYFPIVRCCTCGMFKELILVISLHHVLQIPKGDIIIHVPNSVLCISITMSYIKAYLRLVLLIMG